MQEIEARLAFVHPHWADCEDPGFDAAILKLSVPLTSATPVMAAPGYDAVKASGPLYGFAAEGAVEMARVAPAGQGACGPVKAPCGRNLGCAVLEGGFVSGESVFFKMKCCNQKNRQNAAPPPLLLPAPKRVYLDVVSEDTDVGFKRK